MEVMICIFEEPMYGSSIAHFSAASSRVVSRVMAALVPCRVSSAVRVESTPPVQKLHFLALKRRERSRGLLGGSMI
jgi:hypothetical protein